MRAVHYSLLLAFPIMLHGARLNLGSSLFSHISTGTTFTQGPLFLSPATSIVACARLCALDPGCLTFTFLRGTCQGHSTTMNSSSDHVVAIGAHSYTRLTEADLVRCKTSGVQRLTVPSLGLDTQVVCQDDWMVILKRQDGSVDFYRDWSQYKAGFGNKDGEFWFGLENLHKITCTQSYMMAVELRDWEGNEASALYTNFSVGPESRFYQLHVDFVGGTANDSLTWHSGQKFSTYDADNDAFSTVNCADKLRGSWWYKACAESNLCGDYKHNSSTPLKQGLTWKSWKGATTYSMKSVIMKIRPA
ncbi:microfibril-associated glycoprotein 4-like [Littorina saxatilis]|uniref:microfibril-associated glycoprotein 4-like n=1 Tax=Littorina saxatilis TaxID=31220 RepID=UPI0038B47178